MKKPQYTKDTRLSVKKSSAGLGVFAKDNIQKGSFIMEYTGKIISQAQSDKKEGKYFFALGKKFIVDGSGRENLSRYINHACMPNCETRISRKRIRIYAIKSISPGEEITYHYGKEYFDQIIRPSGCRCKNCVKKIKNQYSP